MGNIRTNSTTDESGCLWGIIDKAVIAVCLGILIMSCQASGFTLKIAIFVAILMLWTIKRTRLPSGEWAHKDFEGLTNAKVAQAMTCELILRIGLFVLSRAIFGLEPIAKEVFILSLATPLSFYWVLIPHRIHLINEKVALDTAERQRAVKDEKTSEALVDYLQTFHRISAGEMKDPNLLETTQYALGPSLAFISQPLTSLQLDNEEKLAFYDNAADQMMQDLGYSQDSALSTYHNLKAFFDQLEVELNPNRNYQTSFDLTEGAQRAFHETVQSFHGFYAYWQARRSAILNDYKSVLSGLEGEAAVNDELAMHVNLINLPSIRVKVDGNSIETDNIVLTSKGIFALEVKNIGLSGNFTLVIESDGRWLRRYRDGRTETMSNASAQNTRHIAYLNRLINQELGTSLDEFIEVKGIVVIANDRISIENRSSVQTVLRKSDVYPYIQQQAQSLTETQLQTIAKVLMAHKLPSIKYPVPSFVDELQSNIKQYRLTLQEIEEWLITQ